MSSCVSNLVEQYGAVGLLIPFELYQEMEKNHELINERANCRATESDSCIFKLRMNTKPVNVEAGYINKLMKA